MKAVEISTDGACSGNPGPAGIGVVIRQADQVLLTVSEAIGDATNNIAEYKAVIRGLQEAKAMGAEHVTLRTDSQLVFFQLKGDYKVRHANMIPLFQEALGLLKGFKKVDCRVVPREENAEADRLATSALKQQTAHDGRSVTFRFGEESPSSTG